MILSCDVLEAKRIASRREVALPVEWGHKDRIYVAPVAVAVFFAIVDADYEPRRALRLSGIFPMNSPN